VLAGCQVPGNMHLQVFVQSRLSLTFLTGSRFWLDARSRSLLLRCSVPSPVRTSRCRVESVSGRCRQKAFRSLG
jgi:hypothetical protein